MKYKRNPGPWRFMSLGKKFFLLAALFFAISCIAFLMKTLSSTWIAIIMPQVVWSILGEAEYISMGCGIALLIAGILSLIFPKARRILWLVKRSLFDPSRGNPLHLKEGQYLPSIRCKEDNEEQERFILKIQSKGFQPEQIKDLAPVISPALTGRLKNYAVTSIHEDEAHNFIDFVIEDVTADHRLVFSSVEEMWPPSSKKLYIDERTVVDLTTSGSILVAAKTRSGKTTGIIAILLQVLLMGPDRYGSEIIIIDPKQAELSFMECRKAEEYA